MKVRKAKAKGTHEGGEQPAEGGRPTVRLPLPGRKMPLLVPRRALASAIALLVLVVATAMAHQWVSVNQAVEAEEISGMPIGERTEWSQSFCLRVVPQKVEADPGQNITFILQWRATHYDCPYWLPYGRSVEGVIVNTNISYENVVVLEETDWEAVDDLYHVFRKEVTVQATGRDGYVRLFRDCAWYFDQKARGMVDVPDDDQGEVEKKHEGTLPAIWKRLQQSALGTLFFMAMLVIIPVAIAAQASPSIRYTRLVSQLSFFGAINIGVLGFWAIRTTALPLTAALPGTSCNYLNYNVGACVVYQLEHFFAVGLWDTWTFIMVLVLAFLILYVALGRAWCGWVCPLGFLQDVMNYVRARLRISRYRLNPFQRQVLNVTRYSIFFAGLLISIMIAIDIVTFYINAGDVYRPICQICPAYPLFTIGQAGLGITTAVGAQNIPWISITALGLFLFASVLVRRPFCRLCPVAVLMMPFNRVSAISLHKDPKKCTRCSMCHRVCPVDVTEVWKEMERTDITVHNCILCMRCVEVCPEDGCLTGRVFGFNTVESSYRKFLKQHDRGTRKGMRRHGSPWWGGGRGKGSQPPGGG